VALANQVPTAAHWSVDQYEKIFDDSLPRRVALVAEKRSVICAFLVANTVDTEREIENVVVADSHRRQGIGKQLLDEFSRISQNDGMNIIFLEARDSNFAAKKLYEKCGFAENGRRRGYYKEPSEDAILYRKFIK
jgi:ribosomal-protein-alanine N-acetyltransferase